ncbi:MAG: hypothetical protein R3F11_19900 [Verrucomicrobiales bacterium]
MPAEIYPPSTPDEIVGVLDPAVRVTAPESAVKFETRDAGLRLEASATQLPGAHGVILDVHTQLSVRLADRSAGGGAILQAMPSFAQLEAQAVLPASLGRWVLLAIHALPAVADGVPPPERRVAVFARVDRILPSAVESPERDPFSPPPVRSLVAEFFSLPAESVPALLDANPPAAGGHAALHAAVQRLVEGGQAARRHVAVTTLAEREAVKSASGEAWRYSARFDEPRLPESLGAPLDPRLKFIAEASGFDFESRPLGISVEVDPKVPRHPNAMRIEAAGTRLLGRSTFGELEAEVDQPTFFAQSVAAEVALPAGGTPLLLAAASEAEPGRTTLAFVRETGAEPGEPAAHSPAMAIRLEHYEAALGEIDAPLLAGDGEAVRAALQDSGTLVDLGVAVSMRGEEGRLRSATERMFPSEYDPPEVLSIHIPWSARPGGAITPKSRRPPTCRRTPGSRSNSGKRQPAGRAMRARPSRRLGSVAGSAMRFLAKVSPGSPNRSFTPPPMTSSPRPQRVWRIVGVHPAERRQRRPGRRQTHRLARQIEPKAFKRSRTIPARWSRSPMRLLVELIRVPAAQAQRCWTMAIRAWKADASQLRAGVEKLVARRRRGLHHHTMVIMKRRLGASARAFHPLRRMDLRDRTRSARKSGEARRPARSGAQAA